MPPPEVVGDTIQEQTRQALGKVETVLKAAGSSLDPVVKVTAPLARPDLYSEMNEARAKFFRGAKPARPMVRFGANIPDVLVAIEAVALVLGRAETSALARRRSRLRLLCGKAEMPGSTQRSRAWSIRMTKKPRTPKGTKKRAKVAHPGMMGDGTEEQNLGERGNPAARIRKKEVVAAFGKKRPTK